MKKGMMLAAVALLAACGVDGEPVRPNYNGTISAGSDGVRAGVGASVIRGNVSVHVGTRL
ncbi:hypothetical protein [Roseovarius aestuariivivens]|uniref:hypothetical protein n=1 Tax=Roseovarius aestuariivivens TaxID=1888910 RepID=UPI001080833E|nr:hypothetical protein [Roseovarius aestuariivivens]